MKYKLLVLYPLDDNGKFTEETGQLAGFDVLGDGNVAIVKILDEHSCLIMEEAYKHKYPYKFTEETGQLASLDVLGDGNVAIVKSLDEHSCLIMEEAYKHKYPPTWRKKKPTIFRATKQWFASIEGFKKPILDAIKNVKWVPPWAKN